MYIKYVILIVIIVIIIGLIIWFLHKKQTLPDGHSLAQPSEFYEKNRNATLAYLSAVYPKGKDSFQKMSSVELAIFYNSLWYYYNCEASFNQVFGTNGTFDTLTKHCWQALPGCGNNWPKLPYTPQGYLYSFNDWINNMWTPWIYSNSNDKPPSYFTAAPPGVNLWSWFTGPAPLFTPQRVIFRMVYEPTPPELNSWKDMYDKNKLLSYKQPKLTPGLTGDWKSYWNYPKNWWVGTPDYGYIEVTYTDILEYGSGAFVWWNGAPGSGVFVNVGKCKRARNKVDATFLLASEMAQTSAGKAKLQEWFLSDDPYDVIASSLINPCRQTGSLVWDPVQNQKVRLRLCGFTNGFVGLPTYANGWNQTGTYSLTDWYTWCQDAKDPNLNRPWMYNLPNYCIDKIRQGSNYIADRIAAEGSFDELLSCMAWWLGYDMIQMTQSSNGSGFWQVEMLELRNFPPEVKDRDYSQFLQVTYDAQNNPSVMWRLDNGWVKKYMDSLSQYLSIRDPTDIMNNQKAEKCVFPVPWETGSTLGWTWNTTCQGTMSDMFTKLSLQGATTPPQVWNQCYPGGIGFGKQPMTNSQSPPFG